MLLRIGTSPEAARRLDDDVDVELAPWKPAGALTDGTGICRPSTTSA
jgi:hypothetical protein